MAKDLYLSDKKIKELANNITKTEKIMTKISEYSWKEISEIPDLMLSYIHHFNMFIDMEKVFMYNKNLSIKFIKHYWNEDNVMKMLTYNEYISKNVFEYAVLHLSTSNLEKYIWLLGSSYYDIIKYTRGNYSNIEDVWKLVFMNPNLSIEMRNRYHNKIEELKLNPSINYYPGMKVHSYYNDKLIIAGKYENKYACIDIEEEREKDYSIRLYGFAELIAGWVDPDKND